MNIRSFDQEDEVSTHNRGVWRDMLRYSRFTLAMAVVNVLMFFVCLFTDIATQHQFSIISFSNQTLVKYGANFSIYVTQDKQYYRLFTAMFLHAGFAHLTGNLYAFLIFLIPTEQQVRNYPKYISTYLLGGMMGSMASLCYFYYIKGEPVIAVGASTSICAIVGLHLAFRFLKIDNLVVPVFYYVVLLGYLFIISLMPDVDFMGHFGSLLGGFLMGLALLEGGQAYGDRKKIHNTQLAGRFACAAYFLILCFGVLNAK